MLLSRQNLLDLSNWEFSFCVLGPLMIPTLGQNCDSAHGFVDSWPSWYSSSSTWTRLFHWNPGLGFFSFLLQVVHQGSFCRFDGVGEGQCSVPYFSPDFF